MNTMEGSLNRMKSGAIASVAVLTMSLAGCEYSKDIQEFPEPWQTLDPGKPLEKFPRIEILEQGGGATIEPGDLVQLGIKAIKLPEGTQHEKGDWWIWIGFRSPKDTAFFSVEPDVATVVAGLRQGTALRFLEGKEATKASLKGPVIDRSGQLQLRPNPFGDSEYYSWRKNTNYFVGFGVQSEFAYSVLEIKRVCKGPLQYRTVRLFDDGPVRICQGLDCYTSHDPREVWYDEAKMEARCSDGKTATFKYGPVQSSNGKVGRSPVQGYFDSWYRDAWQKVPLGVQLK